MFSFLQRHFHFTVVPLLMVSIMPNFVLVLWFIISKCNGSFTEFAHTFSKIGCQNFFRDIWSSALQFDPLAPSIILGYSLWAVLLQILVPGPRSEGPLTVKGNTPVYKDNGFSCYIITMAAFAVLQYILQNTYNMSSTIVYDIYGNILTWLSFYSLFVCVFLYLKGRFAPSTSDSGLSGNFIFDYYWGTELYPRVFGIDIKVFTNCRFGLTVWALVVSICFLKSYELYGFIDSMFVCWALQIVYLTKFFWWEAGYLKTMDISVDRAGFYICWGCLVYVPGFYTMASLYMVHHPVQLGVPLTALILTTGIVSIAINYAADKQRQDFRASDGRSLVWGKPPVVIRAKYQTENGKTLTSPLLVSGWWGIARHFHYFPEWMLAFCWCVPALFENLLPYSYFVFLVILLVHRTFRDDEKCAKKYKKYWQEYCKKVPYKIIPYIF